METIEIKKSDAVFWQDENGRWHNQYGPIEKKSIVRYLNSKIEKDEKGYYLTHLIGDRREKVYFHYADTALHIVDLTIRSFEITALLNTRRRLVINPRNLFVRNDHLYLSQNDHIIKFSERSLVKLAPLLKEEKGSLLLQLAGDRFAIESDAK